MPNLRPTPTFGALVLATALALAGCGHSDKASDAAAPDNVEMPAEEAMSGVAASATPTPDAAATATEAASLAATVAESAAPVATKPSAAASKAQ